MWHELAHTVTMGLTDHKVPRWFSEGLSVYEERRARPGWGDDVSIPFLVAYKQDKLLPVGELNNGFMRPTYPQQIINSYYQASLVCELIERDQGFSAILDMLASYKEGMGTGEIFRDVLGCDLECFDDKFDLYLKERFEGPAAALGSLADAEADPAHQKLSPSEIREKADESPRDFPSQLAMGKLLFEEEKFEEALVYLERAKALFPARRLQRR